MIGAKLTARLAVVAAITVGCIAIVARPAVTRNESDRAAAELGPAREWAGLRLWSSRHVDSFPSGTMHPALAAHNGQLLLVEVYQRALYLSRVAPDSLTVIAKQQLCGPQGQQLVRCVDAAVIKDTLWVTWISQAPGTSTAGGRQMFISCDLQTGACGALVEEHPAGDCALTSFGGQLWVLWRAPGPSGATYLARYDTAAGLQRPQEWSVQRAAWVGATAVDLGAELFLAGIKTLPGAQAAPGLASTSAGQLWAAKFNGQRFYASRMLRGPGNYSSLTGAALSNAIVVAYAHVPRTGAATALQSDIDITLTTASGGEVTTTPYIHDGSYNVAPDATRVGETIFVAHTKWSGGAPGSAGATNHGTFIGKMELKF